MPQADGLGGGTAVLTDPRGIPGVDPNVTGGPGLSSAFAHPPVRRAPYDLPAIGTPEHAAILSGGLDLAGITAAQERVPLVGFAPVVLDPGGPAAAVDLTDVASVPGHGDSGGSRAGGPFPSRRSIRSGGAPASRAGSARTGGRSGSRSASRPAAGARGLPTVHESAGGPAAAPERTRPTPPVVAAAPVGALSVEEMLASLADLPSLPSLDDSPTGELARPFVSGTSLAEWVTDVDDVPPPISVDVFQKAVRAGLAPEAAAAALAATPGADLDEIMARVAAAGVDVRRARASGAEGGLRPRTRREQRARERALTSVRGVTARRLAKGGVLAITALGVVSGATPQTLGALGLDREELTAAQGALDFAGALAPKVNVPALSPEGLARRQQLQRAQVLRQEMADQAVDQAVRASTTAGGALLDLAFEQDEVMEARHQAELARAARDANDNPRRFAQELAAERGWTGTQVQCLDRLWTRESQWNYRAVNRSSGAYGIPQALPGAKMASAGADWQTNAITQIKWGLNYIEDRYRTPCGAWAHSEATGWY